MKDRLTLRQRLNNEKMAGLICVSPFIIGFLMFMLVPMAISLYYAFCDYDILSPARFTGWKNIKRMLADETFYQTLKVTFKFALISVPLRLVFALVVALMLFRSTKVTGVYRALYYLPSIIGGSVAVAILWKRLFASNGLINGLLLSMGIIDKEVLWLGSTKTALDADYSGCLAVWLLHADISGGIEADSHQSLRGGESGRRQRMAAILEDYAEAADAQHSL